MIMTGRIALVGLMFLTTACDGQKSEGNQVSQQERTELNALREEKKTWESEKTKMEAKVDWWGKLKNEAQSELKKVKDELKACQDKQALVSEAKPVAKDQK